MRHDKLKKIPGRRVLRVIGHFVLSLPRRCFGASVGDKFCRNTPDQWRPLYRPFHPVFALFLFWLRQEARGLKTETAMSDKLTGTSVTGLCPVVMALKRFGLPSRPAFG